MRVQEYLEKQREKMIETLEDEYGFDVAHTLHSLLDELRGFDLSETCDIYEVFDIHSCWTFDWEESVDDWFANDILDGQRLEMFMDYMEENLDEYEFCGVVSLFDSTRKIIRYEVLRDYDANIMDYMNAIHLADLGYVEVDDDFFEEMCTNSYDDLDGAEHFNCQYAFEETIDIGDWISESREDDLIIRPIETKNDED